MATQNVDLNNLLDRLERAVVEVPFLVHSFRFAITAVYALQQARAFRHVERSTHIAGEAEQFVPETIRAVQTIKEGKSPNDRWVAGCYFNAAIMRIDAFYERTLRCLIKECQRDDNPEIPELVRGAKCKRARSANVYDLASVIDRRFFEQTAGFQRGRLEHVRREVNRLKHDVLGQPPDGAVTIEEAVEAFREVLYLIEAKPVSSFLKNEYGALPAPV